MANSRVYKGFVWQDKGATLTARIRNNAGTYITQSALTTVARSVFDLDNNGATVIGPTSLTIANVVFDTLQRDFTIWQLDGEQVDTVGWNFKDAIPATAFPKGRNGRHYVRNYQIEYVFTPSSGEAFALVYVVVARNLFSTGD